MSTVAPGRACRSQISLRIFAPVWLSRFPGGSSPSKMGGSKASAVSGGDRPDVAIGRHGVLYGTVGEGGTGNGVVFSLEPSASPGGP